jgi:GNAT superfamily N-acetyltransferase
MTKGLARHDVPGYLLGRIATDKSVAGQGLGSLLLVAAARRCLRLVAEGGGVLLIIDAKNERADAWYASLVRGRAASGSAYAPSDPSKDV